MVSSFSAVLTALYLPFAGPVPATAATTPVTVARYDFDGRSSAFVDDTGRGHTMRLITGRGGRLRPVAHGTGHGYQFPAKCRGVTCPTAVLQTPHSDDLNPGTRPLSFGGTVRLARGQTTTGQNVVQKGYSVTSSQYKLQVDGGAGRPSCVLVDVRSPGIRQVTSSITVADDTWHTIQCRRDGPAFRILVDGSVRGLTRVPATLSVANRHPLSIGGKGAYRDNDQFRGAVDDVYVRIG